MSAEPQDLRRRNFHNMKRRLRDQMLDWRDTNPDMTVKLPGSDQRTPRMGSMVRSEIDDWSHRITTRDAEASILKHNEAIGRAKSRSGEAQ